MTYPDEALRWDAPNHEHPARRMAQRSYRTVAAGDKAGWVALFSPDAIVEDPVGPSPFDPDATRHRGHAGIAAFWDLTIGTVESFDFHITDSFANGMTSANVGAITARFADGTALRTEGVFVHTLASDGRMASMRAYWEFDRAMATAGKVQQP